MERRCGVRRISFEGDVRLEKVPCRTFYQCSLDPNYPKGRLQAGAGPAKAFPVLAPDGAGRSRYFYPGCVVCSCCKGSPLRKPMTLAYCFPRYLSTLAFTFSRMFM